MMHWNNPWGQCNIWSKRVGFPDILKMHHCNYFKPSFRQWGSSGAYIIWTFCILIWYIELGKFVFEIFFSDEFIVVYVVYLVLFFKFFFLFSLPPTKATIVKMSTAWSSWCYCPAADDVGQAAASIDAGHAAATETDADVQKLVGLQQQLMLMSAADDACWCAAADTDANVQQQLMLVMQQLMMLGCSSRWCCHCSSHCWFQ